MRVIASFVGGWGHAEPLLPAAAWARQQGHHVSFAGQAALRDRLVGMGYEFDVVGPDTLATRPQPLIPVDRDAERTVMREHFVADYGRVRAAALGELFDRERADLVICDEVDVGAVIAAECREIRCVTVNVIAAGLLTSPTVVAPAWSELRHDHGLVPDPAADRIGGDAVIAPLPRSFRSPAVPVPASMRFVRPAILDQRPRSASAATRPVVYVTLGTVFNLESGDLLPRLVRAMNGLTSADDLEVVITTGPNVTKADLPRPAAHVRIEGFVAQRELLARCRAVICHAGSGTVVDALSLGIPIVALPMGADQPDNADRCVALGTGITLDPMTAEIDEIRDAAGAVLHERRYSEAAGALADEARMQPNLEDQPALQHIFDGHADGSPERDVPL